MQIFSPVLRFFFGATGAKKNLRKKKRRERFAVCGRRPPLSAAHTRLFQKARAKTFNKGEIKTFIKIKQKFAEQESGEKIRKALFYDLVMYGNK